MLMWKAPALVGVALSLVSASPAQDPLVFINYPLVGQVICAEGKGTAFRVGRNHWLSVAHVTAMHGCTINGAPILVTEQDSAHDFSRLDTPTGVPNALKISCEGFKPGHWYWSTGFANGFPFQTAVALYATYYKAPGGKRVLIGPYSVIPGMSGGPVMDETGAVVGTVNAYVPGTGVSFSRELRDTSICKDNP